MFVLTVLAVAMAEAQAAPPQGDSLATVSVAVRHEARPLADAIVRVLDRTPPVGARTDERGLAMLRLPAGEHRLVVARLGFRPDTLVLALPTARDTMLASELEELREELETVIVAATRGERRVDDTPLRVEVIDEEEIAEKVAMTPGDIAMMLNETSGLRVQATNPALGGANVRMQGLRGRYSLLLADGLPLYGQAGGLGLLQIPPVDLGRVEVIKGAASALYGSAALGGVVNLISRRPEAGGSHTVLINQTSRAGTDLVYFGGAPHSARWGHTLLLGGHRQSPRDLDADGWADLPGYERLVVRPRLYFDDAAGRTAFLTSGLTIEQREGGTLEGRTVPDGLAHVESLETRRADVGALARWLVGGSGRLAGAIVTVRGSAMEQRHDHRFGRVPENDRHRTAFAEAALAIPRTIGDRPVTTVIGAAFQHDAYRNDQVEGFDYAYDVPAIFAQLDADPASWAAVSASARLDAHERYGAELNPRVSLLLRRPDRGPFANWTARLSAGTGSFAPTPFTEETDATGLTPVVLPPGGLRALAVERARSASLDLGGAIGTALGSLELNATAFGSRVARALQVRPAPGLTPGGTSQLAIENAPGPVRTAGAEVLARLVRPLGGAEGHAEEDEGDAHDAEPPMLRVTATYTWLRSTECTPGAIGAGDCLRREVPLTPRHAAGMVASVEQHGRSRVGLEVYYTGRQALDDNPYRERSRPYVIVGLLGERAFDTRAGVARVFLNFENLTNVRQTRHDPLVRPTRGPGGRWTTDAWTDLVGFTVNGGVRFTF